MLITPINVDVPLARWPWMNWLLIVATVGTSLWLFSAPEWGTMDGAVGSFIHTYEDGVFAPSSILSVFAHADLTHLLGNMVFLFAFGNAVNAKLGNGAYLGLYLVAGFVSSSAWWILDAGPGSAAVGASGAIMGVMGAFVVFFPLNDVVMFWWVLIRVGTFRVSARVIVTIYVLLDLFGFFTGDGIVANSAHLGGFAFGFALMSILVLKRFYPPTRAEKNLWQVLDRLPYNPHRMPKGYEHLWDPYAEQPQPEPRKPPEPAEPDTIRL